MEGQMTINFVALRNAKCIMIIRKCERIEKSLIPGGPIRRMTAKSDQGCLKRFRGSVETKSIS
jgi:hypothetical protein